jgi:hypothetical protein
LDVVLASLLLTVCGPAIAPAARYNASPLPERQSLELEHVTRQSLRFDLHLSGQALTAWLRSRGSVQARGTPATRPGNGDG